MLQKKFKNVFWLSLLPILLLIISITLIVPSIRLESMKDDKGDLITKYYSQQSGFKDLNFLVLTILQGFLVIGILAIVIIKIIKEKNNLFKHNTKNEKMIFIETILAITFVVTITIVYIFLTYTFARWYGEFRVFSTRKDLEILDYHSPATQAMIAWVKKFNNVIKLKMMAGIITYFVIFAGVFIAKVSFTILKGIEENKNKVVK